MTFTGRLINVPEIPIGAARYPALDDVAKKQLDNLATASRKVDSLGKSDKVGSGLADWGEDVVAPWLARTAQADHIGGKALRGLGWIGKQHSKIPGYDWMEGRLAQMGAGAFGALGLDPRIGMLVGTVLMPDATDFLPGIGSALGTGGKLARKSAAKVGKLLPTPDASLFHKIYSPDVARVLDTYSEAKLHKGMTTAKNAVSIAEKHKVPRVAVTKTGMAKKARMETVDGVEQSKRYLGASDLERIPQDMPRRYQDMIPLTPEEAAGFGARKFDVEKIPPDDTLRTGISEEWNRLLDERNAVIDAEWVKYMEIVDRLDNWPVDELGNLKVFHQVSISPKTGKMKPFNKSNLKYSHVESQRIIQLRRIRDLRTSPIDAAVQGFTNKFQEGFNKAIKGTPGAKPNSALKLEQHHAWANIEGSTFTAMLDQVGRAHKLDAWRHIAQTYGTVPGYGLANMWNLPGKKSTKVHQKLHSWLRELGFEEYWRDLAKARPNMQAAEQMGWIDDFFETVYYPSLMRTALMMSLDPAAKLDLVNLPKGMVRKAIAAQKDGSAKLEKLAPGALDDAIKAAYAPGGAATRKGWWATPDQIEQLERWAGLAS